MGWTAPLIFLSFLLEFGVNMTSTHTWKPSRPCRGHKNYNLGHWQQSPEHVNAIDNVFNSCQDHWLTVPSFFLRLSTYWRIPRWCRSSSGWTRSVRWRTAPSPAGWWTPETSSICVRHLSYMHWTSHLKGASKVELERGYSRARKPGLITEPTLHKPKAWWSLGPFCSKAHWLCWKPYLGRLQRWAITITKP